MKKRLISLLLILALCLMMSACSASPSTELLAAACGVWYSRGYLESSENPSYFELKEDGTGSINGAEALTWTGERYRDDKSIWIVTISTQSDARYRFEITMDGNTCVDAELTIGREEGGPANNYAKVNTTVQVEWFRNLLTQWYANDEDNGLATSVTLRDDGTAKLDETSYFWTCGSYSYDQDRIDLYLFNELGVAYTISLNIRGNGLYEMNLHEFTTDRSASYLEHAMLKLLNNGSWRSFDKVTMIDDYLYLGTYASTATIAGTEYTMQFDSHSSQDSLTVNFLDGEAVRYTARIFMDGAYPMATLTDCQNGREVLYYNDYYGYDEDHPDAAYYNTLNLVYWYVNGHSIYTLENDEYLEQEERLPYIYAKLQELGDYKQAAEYLDRFTVVPDKLTEVIQYNTDAQNNVSESRLSAYGYDENGTLVWACGEDAVEMYGVNESKYIQYFTYDDNGVIKQIQIGSGNSIQAIGTPIFDTVGKLVGMNVRERYDEYTTIFTFDVEGRVVRMGVSESESAYPLIYEYTYDEAGRMISKVKTTGYNGSQIVTTYYTYDGDAVVEKKEYWAEYGDAWSVTYTYTNDEKGRPQSAEITSYSSGNDYKYQEVKYVYKDLYFFDSTGLVSENN